MCKKISLKCPIIITHNLPLLETKSVIYTPPPIPEIPVGFQLDSGIPCGFWLDSGWIPEFWVDFR